MTPASMSSSSQKSGLDMVIDSLFEPEYGIKILGILNTLCTLP
ncbi:MAG: hypothetical protein UR63_C0057G0011, partial [Candidatus Roizmanbacteria bacterium GW2011_GWC2_35_12]